MINLIIDRTVNKLLALISLDDIYKNVEKELNYTALVEGIDIDSIAATIGETFTDSPDKLSEIASQIDLEELAGNVDLAALVDHLDMASIANEISSKDIANEMDLDYDELAQSITPQFNSHQLRTMARNVNMGDVEMEPFMEAFVEQLDMDVFVGHVTAKTYEKCHSEIMSRIEERVADIKPKPAIAVVDPQTAETLTTAAFKDPGLLDALLNKAVERLLVLADEAVREGKIT